MREKIINNRQNILLGIIIVLALWNIFNTNGIKTDVKSYKEKIENIQSEVDSAQLVNKEMDEKVLVIKETVNSITKEIHEIDNNIEMVKEQTDEKVISVGFIGNAELERLFAERYSNWDGRYYQSCPECKSSKVGISRPIEIWWVETGNEFNET